MKLQFRNFQRWLLGVKILPLKIQDNLYLQKGEESHLLLKHFIYGSSFYLLQQHLETSLRVGLWSHVLKLFLQLLLKHQFCWDL